MIDKILKLLDVGFTREQIAQMLNAAAVVAPVPDPAPVPVPDPAPVPVPAPAPAGGAPDMGALLQAINQMGSNIVSALQRAQIGGAQNPYNPDPMAQIDAITAQIINPTHNNGGANNG